MDKVLVTGGSGFIGQYVVEELFKRGILPVIYDFPNDIRNFKFCSDKYSAVIHLAGILGTEELFERTDEAIDINIKGTINVLNYCKITGASYVGITMPEVWSNVYQATKKCSRILASAWHENFGVPVSHVRAFNAYGAGQKRLGVQKIVPTFSYAAWTGTPYPVWGDGYQTVDLIHASDIARMLVDAMRFGEDRVFDAGTGEPMCVNEVVERIDTIVFSEDRRRSEVNHLPMRKGEKEHTDIVAKGEGWDILGWKPTFNADLFKETVLSYRPSL